MLETIPMILMKLCLLVALKYSFPKKYHYTPSSALEDTFSVLIWFFFMKKVRIGFFTVELVFWHKLFHITNFSDKCFHIKPNCPLRQCVIWCVQMTKHFQSNKKEGRNKWPVSSTRHSKHQLKKKTWGKLSAVIGFLFILLFVNIIITIRINFIEMNYVLFGEDNFWYRTNIFMSSTYAPAYCMKKQIIPLIPLTHWINSM